MQRRAIVEPAGAVVALPEAVVDPPEPLLRPEVALHLQLGRQPLEGSRKVLPQTSQQNGLDPTCDLRWASREALCLNPAAQSVCGQSKGRSPECCRKWLRRCTRVLNAREHTEQAKSRMHPRMFWWCDRTCASSLEGLLKLLLQYSHLICRPMPWVRRCYLRL